MTQAKAFMPRHGVKVLRKRLKLSGAQLSKRCGISADTLASFECGRRNLSPELREKIQRALIQAVADRVRIERQERLLAFKPLSDGLEKFMPELSLVLQQYSTSGSEDQNLTLIVR